MAASIGGAECWNSEISSSTAGGRYLGALEVEGVPTSDIALDLTDESLVAIEEIDVDEADDNKGEEPMVNMASESGLEVRSEGVMGTEEGEGKTMLASSASVGSSSSVDGKKLRKRDSACHFDACLNSTQTSMRPGRDKAGSSRSKWFVVL